MGFDMDEFYQELRSLVILFVYRSHFSLVGGDLELEEALATEKYQTDAQFKAKVEYLLVGLMTMVQKYSRGELPPGVTQGELDSIRDILEAETRDFAAVNQFMGIDLRYFTKEMLLLLFTWIAKDQAQRQSTAKASEEFARSLGVIP